MKRGLALLLLAIPLASQTVINGSRQIKGVWDASSAASTLPFKSGTALPAACVTGEAFLNTSAPEGQNVYVCTAANVWTLQGGGASMAAQLGDFAVTRTGSTVLTIGNNCSAATPCNVRTAGVVRSFNSPATATVSSGTGTAYVYVDSGGTLTVGQQNLGLACAGCTAASGVAAFPASSVPLFTWTATSGTWDVTGGRDRRAFLSDRAVAAGSGITASEAGGSTVVAVDTATVPRYSAGISLPATCTVGQQFIKSDAPAEQRVYFCTATDTWTQPSGSGLPVNLNTTAPLTGGGSLGQDRTLNCPTCTTSAAALSGDSIVKGGGGQTLRASGASIDDSHNISTPGSITTGAGTGTTGKLSLSGATSGTVDVTVAAAAGTWTMTLPASGGTSGQAMITNGSGTMSFGTLGMAGGGTGLTAAADDQVMVGNGTAWQNKLVPDCQDTSGYHLNYNAASNSFLCGSSGGGGGASTALNNLSAVAINAALLPGIAAGSDFGSATRPWKDLFLAGTSGTPTTNNYRITGVSTGGTRTVTLPDANSVTVQPSSAVSNKFLTGISAAGAVTRAQPAAADLSNGVTGSGAVALATAPTLTGPILQSYTVGTLPAIATNKVVIVTDGNSASDCTAGGGSNRVLCHYTGSAWAALGDGNTGSAPGFNAITTASNTSATMTVGTGASITYSGSGAVNANHFKGNATVAAADIATAVLDDSVAYCADAGASDAYACNLTPAPAAYVTGGRYRFKANTANTAAATINLNSLGTKTIKKVPGGVTTDLADNDIRPGQIVDLVYDGTNMQMQSTLGNAASGSGTTVSVNGSALAAATGDLTDATPAQPAMPTSNVAIGPNVRWQKDASTPTNISAYAPIRNLNSSGQIAFAHVSDEFLGGANAAGSVGQLGWFRFVIGSGSGAAIAGESGRPGIYELDTGATSGSSSLLELYPGGSVIAAMLPADNFDEVFIVRPVTCDAATQVRVGLSGHATQLQPNDGIYIEKLHADTSFYLVVRKDGTGQQRTTTAVGTCSSNAWHRFRIRRKDSTSIAASLDGGSEVCITSGATGCDVNNASHIPTGGMSPRASVENSGAASKKLDLDYFDLIIATTR